MPGLKDYRDGELQEELRYRREAQAKREFNGKNWPFYFKMQEFKNKMILLGLKRYPNLVEIDEDGFAHEANYIQSTSCYVTQANTDFIEGMKFTRYATAFFREVGHSAGRGVAFVAVPADPNDWNASQHNRVPLKLRFWKFCLCDHKYGHGVNDGHCVTKYTCKECGWTERVDSSG